MNGLLLSLSKHLLISFAKKLSLRGICKWSHQNITHLKCCISIILVDCLLQEIVESVIKNSTSFSERNEFSQEKYVKRKQRK